MTMEEAIQQLDGAEMMLLNREFIQFNQAIIMAISALRIQQKQESECTKCSGIMYRQTDSGKIIPVDQRCGVKITPPCYVPDGDGCAYQIYGDNNDEPIARCKSCPLCQSDKIRLLPWTSGCRWMVSPCGLFATKDLSHWLFWALVEVCEESIFLTNNLGGRTEYAADVELEDDGITVYHRKLEEGTV